MKASIVDLRYKMNDVLKALDRNEEVTILYRGKATGKITPLEKKATSSRVKDHPFFASQSEEAKSVEEVMGDLRGSRYS